MIDLFLQYYVRLSVWTMILLSGVTVILGDLFGKMWSENLNKTNLLLSVIFYALSSIFYMPVLLKEGLTVTSIAWSLISIIGFLVIGIVIYKETLTSIQVVAVILGVIALILFSFAE